MASLAPISDAAVSSLGYAAAPPSPPATYDVTAYETLLLISGVAPRLRYTVSDSLAFSSGTSSEAVYMLLDNIHFAPGVSAAIEIIAGLHEDVRFGSAIGFTAGILAAEGLNLADNNDYDVYRILVAAEALRLSTGVGATLEIADKLYEALAFIESIEFINALSASEVIDFADQLTLALHTSLRAADALEFTTALGQGITIVTSVSEDISLSDDAAFNLHALFSASDYIAFAGNVPLGDADYEMWVVNSVTLGATQYTNTPFNSMAVASERTFGLTETGLYELTGPDDAGVPIEAAVQTGLLDFGTHENKAIARAYLYVGSGDHIYLRTISSRMGQRDSQWYEIIPRTEDDVEPRRVRLARGVKSVTWGFEVKNIDGGSLDLRYLDAVPVVLRRRR